MIAGDARGVPLAMFGGVSALRSRFMEWDAAITCPVGSVRRIGFVQLASGVGATTLVHEVLRVVSARRAMSPLAVDLSVDGGLAGRLDIAETASRADRATLRTSADVAALVHRTALGAWGVRPADAAAHPAQAWAREVAPIMRFHELVIADFGTRDPDRDLADVAALCDAVCVVAEAGRGQAELARVVVEAIVAMPERPQVAMALIDAERAARRVPAVVAAQTPHPVLRIPHDAGLSVGSAARSLQTRQAVLRLAAQLVRGDEARGDAPPAPAHRPARRSGAEAAA